MSVEKDIVNLSGLYILLRINLGMPSTNDADFSERFQRELYGSL